MASAVAGAAGALERIAIAPRGCVVLWLRRRPLTPDDLAPLSPQERERAEGIAVAAVRERFVLATALLRRAAGALTATAPAAVALDRRCEDCGRQHGRPRIAGGVLHASITHADDVVGVALTRAGPVGLDVEEVGRDVADVAAAVLAPQEPLTRPGDFFRYWTRKEAVVKATGDGIGVGLASVVVSPATARPRLLRYGGVPAPPACLRDLAPTPSHAAAVAVLTRGAVDVTEAWPEEDGG
jgi:4'-phosphopantetheinyl transferase